MKKYTLVILFVLLISSLFASQFDDLQFAVGLYSDKNYKLAKVELQNFIASYPESELISDAKFLLANIHLFEKNINKALKIFEELYQTDDNPAIRAEILLGLGQCYFFLDKYNKAESSLNDFISNFPKHKLNWKANYFLGRIQFQKKSYEKALKYLEKAKKTITNIRIDTAFLEVFIAQKNEKKIDNIINHILKNNESEQQNRALIIYHNFNLRSANYNKILNIGFERITKRSQYYDDYALLLAIAYYNVNDFSNSLKRLKKLTSEKAQYYRALCLYEIEKINDAKKILNKLTKSTNEEINSNSFFYLAKMEEDKQKSIEMLQRFITANSSHVFIPSAYYQIGYNYFLLEKYRKAIENFTKATTASHLSPDPGANEIYKTFEQKYIYLTAESHFLNNNKGEALGKYSQYMIDFPQGDFVDEALFKIGLIHFELKKYADAYVKFDRLLNEYPNSDKVGMSNYYLGEIYFNQSKYPNAMKYFKDALKGKSDLGYVWERIAHIHYFQEEYNEALQALDNIPDLPKYAFDRFILKGNIYFASKKYEKALKAFSFAEDNSRIPINKETALSRKAWTLYQLKRFDEASQLYSRLSGSAETPDKYIIRAATSAFSAEDYLRAIDFFKQYEKNFPYGKDFNSARLGIADSYYNLGDYVNAVIYYKKLITPESDEKVMNNALNGLRWASEQTEQVDFLDEITQLLQVSNSKDFRVKLLDRKIYFEYRKGLWEDVISTCKEIEILYPEYKKLIELKLLKAISYVEMQKLSEAEEILSELSSQKTDADVLLNWAKLCIIQHDFDSAVSKLRKASMISRRTEIWLKLLELELQLKNKYFVNDYSKYMEFAQDKNKQLAQLFMVEWQIENKDFKGFQTKLKELLKSKYKPVKAKAQFLKGYSLFKQENYEEAIPELLRVRYLYPEFLKVRDRSEAIACIAYINAGRVEEARQLFDTIKVDISEEFKEKIEQMLKEGAER
ncbi:MAG: tetratricopeptide repeat protein [Candidatus Cloacimonetes bacterium]|nr:tetratricopeptide repeat protein [Candidatus Cloacimonadota bacterium]